MEAGRPVIRNPSVLEGVVSLLVTFVLIYPSLLRLRAQRTFEERWALPEWPCSKPMGGLKGLGIVSEPPNHAIIHIYIIYRKSLVWTTYGNDHGSP